MASHEELVDAACDGAESEDNQAGDNPQLRPTERSTTFTFTSSGEFLLLRRLLKGLSLWHPRSSCCFWRYFYPGLISLLLACTAIWALVQLFLEGDFTLNVSIYKLFFFVQLASAWSSHFAGSIYFRSRDFEDNMIFITLDDARQLERFRKKIKYHKWRIVVSLVAAFAWLGVNVYYSISQGYLTTNGILSDLIKELLSVLLNVYFAGMYLAVLWVIDILQLVSNARLRNQHQKFLKWTQGAEAAINDHICNYTTKVETSCRRLRFWFFIHNVSLSILVPIVVLRNLEDGDSLKLHTVALVGIYIFTIWAAPLYLAEQIERNDERFCCEVNNFCPEQLITTKQNTAGGWPAEFNWLDGGESYQQLTFVSRPEVQVFVAYLKNIRSGFLAVGYTFQLKLSIVAAIFSIGAQVFKTDFGKSSELAMLINNMTSV